MSRQAYSTEPVVIETRTAPGQEGTFLLLVPFGETPERIAARDLWDVQHILVEAAPEKVILDLELPIRRGIELLTLVRETCPDAEIVARVRAGSRSSLLFSLDLDRVGLRMTPRPGC